MLPKVHRKDKQHKIKMKKGENSSQNSFRRIDRILEAKFEVTANMRTITHIGAFSMFL